MTVVAQNIVIESPGLNRRQPLLLSTAMGVKEEKDGRNGKRIGEVAGRSTAECAAVCCCCPCAVMHLLVLAVYKVPTRLCKKALRKNKRRRLLRRKKKNLLEDKNQRKGMKKKSGSAGVYYDDRDDDDDDDDDDESQDGGVDLDIDHKVVGVIDAVDLDSEMWDRFYGAGFWRSSSQRVENENEKQ